MKELAKMFVWTIALMAVTVAVLYGVWLVLLFMVMGETTFMWLVIAGEFVLFSLYFWLVKMASC